MLASKRSLPFMFGSAVLPELDACEELKGFEEAVLSSSSEGDVLLRRPELDSDGELRINGSKRIGGGDDSGDEL